MEQGSKSQRERKGGSGTGRGPMGHFLARESCTWIFVQSSPEFLVTPLLMGRFAYLARAGFKIQSALAFSEHVQPGSSGSLPLWASCYSVGKVDQQSNATFPLIRFKPQFFAVLQRQRTAGNRKYTYKTTKKPY